MFNLGARAGFLRGKSPYDLGVKLRLNIIKKRNLRGSMTKTEKALYRLGICVCITGLIIVGIEWLFG